MTINRTLHQSDLPLPPDDLVEVGHSLPLSELRKQVAISNGQPNGLHAVYHPIAARLAKTLKLDDLATSVVFKVKNNREGFRTYLSQYGREVLNSYENGWRFSSRFVDEGGLYIVWVWKTAATMDDKKQRSHSRKK